MSAEPYQIGFLTERGAILWLKAIAYTVAVMLVILSVLGNFYWLTHRTATLNPLRIVSDVLDAFDWFAIAVLWQFITSGIQFGSLVLAKRNPLWVALWFIALCASAVPNINSYGEYLFPLFSYFAYGIIVIGDILPEVITVIRNRR